MCPIRYSLVTSMSQPVHFNATCILAEDNVQQSALYSLAHSSLETLFSCVWRSPGNEARVCMYNAEHLVLKAIMSRSNIIHCS